MNPKYFRLPVGSAAIYIGGTGLTAPSDPLWIRVDSERYLVFTVDGYVHIDRSGPGVDFPSYCWESTN